MNPIYVGLLRGQIARDTIFCRECAMYGESRKADVRYTVHAPDDAFSMQVPSCSEHLQSALSVPNSRISASEPLQQPAYVELLERALLSC